MTQAMVGNTVTVHYTGKLEDGTVFDTSASGEPLEFTLGAQQVIPGFEAGITGMVQGESKTLVITPEDGYGQHRDELVATFGRENFPEGMTPEVGQELLLQGDDAQQIPVVVTGVTAEAVTLDANHPLAGKTLTFDIELVEIV